MILKNLITPFYFIIFLLINTSCQKDLDITEFSDDFRDYKSEPRIEALILPLENTAIVRIDRSILIDDEVLFDCLDNDDDWDPATDDIGSDGQKSIDKNEDGDFEDFILGDIAPDEDGSENNGKPDCNEPNVDEYDETLPEIHIKDCNVKMHQIVENDSTTCELAYKEDGGNFFTRERNSEGRGFTIDNIRTNTYGAYTPDPNQCEINWNDYNARYSFEVDCLNNESFNSIVQPTEPIKLSKPPIYIISKDDSSNIFQCSNYECLMNNSSVYNMNTNAYDTVYFGRYDSTGVISFASFNQDFQVVQYMLTDANGDGMKNEDKYYHGYAIQSTEIRNNISLLNETIIPELFDGDGDGFGDIDTYFYKVFTFSDSYKNYYYDDGLELLDPSRTNLRDASGNPVMGAFGSMSASIIYFRIINCFANFTKETCENPDITYSSCQWYDQKWIDWNQDGIETDNENVPICFYK